MGVEQCDSLPMSLHGTDISRPHCDESVSRHEYDLYCFLARVVAVMHVILHVGAVSCNVVLGYVETGSNEIRVLHC